MTHNEEIDQSFKTDTDVKICKQEHFKKENGEFLATFRLYFPLDPFTFKILLN